MNSLPRDGDQAPAARRERERGGLHHRRGRRPLRPERHQERGAGRRWRRSSRPRRRVGRFKDLFHFCREVDRFHVNRRVLENLVQSGAMDCFGVPRWDLVGLHRPGHGRRGQGAGRQGPRARRPSSAGRGGRSPRPSTPRASPGATWTRFAKEKESLGFYLSGHPLMEQEDKLRRYASHRLSELERVADGTRGDGGRRGGHVAPEEEQGKGEMYGILALEDLEARVEAMLFSKDDVFEEYHDAVVKDAARPRGGQGEPRRRGGRGAEGQGQGHRQHGGAPRPGRRAAQAEGHGGGPDGPRDPLRGGVARGAGGPPEANEGPLPGLPRRGGRGARRAPGGAGRPSSASARASPSSRT